MDDDCRGAYRAGARHRQSMVTAVRAGQLWRHGCSQAAVLHFRDCRTVQPERTWPSRGFRPGRRLRCPRLPAAVVGVHA
jgi:hypothetical protein